MTDSLLDRRFLPVETARQLSVALRGYGTMVFTFDREGTGALVIESLQQLHARIDRWVEANRPYLVEVQPIERAFDGGEEPIQGMVCGTVAEMIAAEKQLLASDVAGADCHAPYRIRGAQPEHSRPLTSWLLERRGAR